MSDLIEILAPIFVLIILGFLSVKLRFLSSDDYPVLSSFVMKVAFPCLLLTKLSVLDLSMHFRWDILIIFGMFVGLSHRFHQFFPPCATTRLYLIRP